MTNFSLRQALAPMAVAALAVTSIGAYAVDGVLLIDQARVGAAGGFPYKISRSGSYRLAGNLNLGNGALNTNAIEIVNQGVDVKLTVTLDLNGFEILGTPFCDFIGGVPTCSNGGSGSGVRVVGNATVSVTNGAIRGMGFHGIACTSCELTVEGLVIANNAATGITSGGGTVLIRRSRVFLNRRGVAVGDRGALLEGNVIQHNLEWGVSVGNSMLLNNIISYNGGLGLNGSGNGYANNSFTFNNGGNSNPQVAAGNIQTSGNVCGTAACP